MAIVKLQLNSDVEVGNVDQTLIVLDPKKKKIGELKFSKGSVEWWPKGNSVHAHKYSWQAFADALEKPETKVRVAAKKPVAKKAAAPVAKAKQVVKRVKKA
jgi:hypothetical protein